MDESVLDKYKVGVSTTPQDGSPQSEAPSADWEPPYLVPDSEGTPIDVVRRLPDLRMAMARPLPEGDTLSKNEALQNRYLSATGDINGLPVITSMVGAAFHNVTTKDGAFIMVNSTVGLVRDSRLMFPVESFDDVEVLTMEEALKKFGFKAPTKKAKNDAPWEIPAVFANNSWRKTKNADRSVGNLAFTSNDRVNGENYSIDCRIASIFVDTEQMDKAIAGDEDAHPQAVSYIAAQTALSYGRLIDILAGISVVKGEPFTRPANERETFRLIQVWMSQGYYGRSPVSKNSTYETYHAHVRRLRDPARAGGQFQNVTPGRKTAGLDSQFFVPVRGER